MLQTLTVFWSLTFSQPSLVLLKMIRRTETHHPSHPTPTPAAYQPSALRGSSVGILFLNLEAFSHGPQLPEYQINLKYVSNVIFFTPLLNVIFSQVLCMFYALFPPPSINKQSFPRFSVCSMWNIMKKINFRIKSNKKIIRKMYQMSLFFPNPTPYWKSFSPVCLL